MNNEDLPMPHLPFSIVLVPLTLFKLDSYEYSLINLPLQIFKNPSCVHIP